MLEQLKCKQCLVNDIKHKRKLLCTACYSLYRKERWRENEIKRSLDPSYLEKRRIYKAAYFQRNKQKLSLKKRLYERERLNHDILFLLKKQLRRRLTEAVKNNQKSGSAIKDLGCSIEEFKRYLESKFQPGMTWDNYGEWHIDHIRPLSSFDLSDPEQLKIACHYTNLQPLWAKDNLSKGNKYVSQDG
jgi:hypothetical protein